MGKGKSTSRHTPSPSAHAPRGGGGKSSGARGLGTPATAPARPAAASLAVAGRAAGPTAVNTAHFAPVVQATLARIEPELAPRTTERFVVVDPKSGRVLVDVTGTANGVPLPAHTWARLSYTIWTHNHPNGCSFSREDIQTASDFRARAIRAVTDRYVYEMRPNPRARPGQSGWSWRVWQDEIQPAYRAAAGPVRRELQREIAVGTVSPADYDIEFFHRRWQRAAAATGGRLLYTRTPRR